MTAGLPFKYSISVMRSALSDSDLRSREFQRILLIKPSSLGDVVHALPVLHGLRKRYPDAKIDWLISSSLAPLLDLPIRRILVSHGDPVLENGQAALAAALSRT